jgi:hypothetical protein
MAFLMNDQIKRMNLLRVITLCLGVLVFSDLLASHKTVAAMVADAGIAVGDSVFTFGYNSQGDGGGNEYTIVASGTGTVDGGRYINLTGISGQARGEFPAGRVNVKQFGAVGDGSNDDTSAGNNAATYVGILGGDLHFPPGTYSFTDTLEVPAGVRLVSQNRSATLRADDTVTQLVELSGSRAAVDGFVIDGNDNVSNYIIEFATGVERGRVHDCEITDTGADNLTTSGGVVAVELRDSTENNEITDNYFHDFANGVRVNKDAKRTKIKGNEFEAWGLRAVWVRGETPAPSFVDVDDNWFGTPLAGDIKAPLAFDKVTSAIQYVRVTNNKLEGPGLPHNGSSPSSNTATPDMISLHGVSYFQVLDNMLTGGGEVGITVSQGSLSGIVTDNLANFIDINGISIGSASGDTTRRVLLANNHVENVSEDALTGTADKALSGISMTNTHSSFVDGNYTIDSQGTTTMKHGVVIEDSTNIGRGTNWISGVDVSDWLDTGDNIFLEADHFERNETSPRYSTLTISSGEITVRGKYHRINTEASASTDNLDTINGGVDGMEIILRTSASARDVVIKDGTGNIYLGNSGGDVTLSDNTMTITLFYDGLFDAWLER